MLPLWCDAGGLITPKGASDDENVRAFVEQCQRHGVTRLFPSGGTRILAEVAREKGIEVHPYVAFNSHGGMGANYAWSTNFVLPPVGSVEARQILDRHRPIFSHATYELRVSDFAKQHPEYSSRNRNGGQSLTPGERLALCLAISEVRSSEQDKYLSLLRNVGGSGVQLEFVLGNVDDSGVTTGGYEDAMANAFEHKFRRHARDVANDDLVWVKFRAEYVTLFLKELRAKLRQVDSRAKFSTTLIARDPDEYIKVLQDWPVWLDEGLVDEFYIWFRTTSDLREVERQTAHAAEVIRGRVPLVVELSCYHPGSFQDPQLLVEAARRAKTHGANHVGVYRSHAVDQLGMWHVLDEIAGL